MAAVTLHSDFGAQEKNLPLFPHLIYLLGSDETRCHDLSFLNAEFKASFSTPLSPSLRASLLFAIRVSAYLRLLIFLLAIWILACDY